MSEAVEQMSKRHLQWIVDSFMIDVAPMEEEEMRAHIADAAGELGATHRIRTKLRLFDVSHSMRVLVHFVLESILNAEGLALSEQELTERVRAREQSILDEASDPKVFQYADAERVDILRLLLEVALEDNEMSEDEFRLIEKLRERLELTRKQRRLLEAQLEAFPQRGKELHTHSQVSDAVRLLQKRGVVFYCNKAENGALITVPDELRDSVKDTLGIELTDLARERFWHALTGANLRDTLKTFSLPSSGTKDERVVRIEQAEIPPRDALQALKNDELYEICGGLHGVAVSGSKEEKVERILDYFDKLVIHESDESDSADRIAFLHLVELAFRDYANLRQNNVITKDNEIERLFELGTTYIFRDLLGADVLPMIGSKHPDGGSEFPDGTLLLWDCKSQEKLYSLPTSHQDQFKRYCREFRSYLEPTSASRVNCFVVVVPGVEDEDDVALRCRAAKATSGSDTDFCVIAAEDLKWLGEKWQASANGESLNLQLFNDTGVLSRRRLEQSLKLFHGV